MLKRTLKRLIARAVLVGLVALGMGAAHEASADGEAFRAELHDLLDRFAKNNQVCTNRMKDAQAAMDKHEKFIDALTAGENATEAQKRIREVAEISGYKLADALIEARYHTMRFNEECSIAKGRIDDEYGELMERRDAQWSPERSPLTQQDIAREKATTVMLLAALNLQRAHTEKMGAFIYTVEPLASAEANEDLSKLAGEYEQMLTKCEGIVEEGEANLKRYADAGGVAGSAYDEAVDRVNESTALINGCTAQWNELGPEMLAFLQARSWARWNEETRASMDRMAQRDGSLKRRVNAYVLQVGVKAE